MINLEQFNILKTKLTAFVAIEGKKRLYNDIYSTNLCHCTEQIRKEALLYAYVFNMYQMNLDGSTTGKVNFITEDEFMNIVYKVQRICQEIDID